MPPTPNQPATTTVEVQPLESAKMTDLVNVTQDTDSMPTDPVKLAKIRLTGATNSFPMDIVLPMLFKPTETVQNHAKSEPVKLLLPLLANSVSRKTLCLKS